MKLAFSPKISRLPSIFLLAPDGGLDPVKAVCDRMDETLHAHLCELVASQAKKPEDKGLCDLHHPGFGKAILVFPGLDPKPGAYSGAGARLGEFLKKSTATDFQLFLPEGLSAEDCGFFFEGLRAGVYRFNEFKRPSEEGEPNPEKLTLKVIDAGKDLKDAAKTAEIIAEGVDLARNCANKPGNEFTPTHFKNEIEKLAEFGGLKAEVIDLAQAKKLGMGCFCSVAKGSEEPAYVLTLSYKARSKNAGHLMMVGKGLTFDSGGISLKPSASMEEMKFDMCGGAAVLGAMHALLRLKPNVNLTCVIPTSENLVNGKASKPGDIYKSYSGLNVEVINTDAEGRLILADAMAYALHTHKPEAVIDLATLTGACLVALGTHYAGLFSNDDRLANKVRESAEKTAESVWRLPLDERFAKQIKSEYADIKNTGGRYGGAITAAEFLKKFAGETPWAHLDIAGTAWNNKDTEHYPNGGASGFGVRLLIDLALNWKFS